MRAPRMATGTRWGKKVECPSFQSNNILDVLELEAQLQSFSKKWVGNLTIAHSQRQQAGAADTEIRDHDIPRVDFLPY